MKCKCGSENFHTEQRGVHTAAICDNCLSFIKFIPTQPQRFYFGKYKGWLVEEVGELGYLEWFLKECKPRPAMREAVKTRIEQIEHAGR